MNKWNEVLPAGISKCLSEYFERKCIWAPQFDPRFPNQNQTRRCFINYVDLKRCEKVKGEDNRDCDYFKKTVQSLCPNAWTEKWAEQLEQGAFPVDI
jgi:cytochrome c oxidase subunit 6b